MKQLRALFFVLGACVLPVLASAAPRVSPAVPGTFGRSGPVPHGPGTSLSPYYSATGLVSLSIDALGTLDTTGLIQVQKPAGATVRAAYLMAASTGFCSCVIADGDVRLAGSPITWDLTIPNSILSSNSIADVTSIVAPIVDAALPGIVDLTVVESGFVGSGNIDGTILAVVFDDPALTENQTAVIFFGAQNILGDDFNINLADPATPSDPDYVLDLSLGISYSYQESGAGQASLVDVEGSRLTSSAGGEDDGASANGALITAGGIGDSNANPPDPNASPPTPTYDDELYDLKPFVTDGETNINIHTVNPSNDDNIFFAGILVSGAAVVGEGAILTPVAATNPVGTTHTVTATLRTTTGDPIVGKKVDFTVVSGPHVGTSVSAVTDSNGIATFTYLGVAAGLDSIRASFQNATGATVFSNTVTKLWLAPATDIGVHDVCATDTTKLCSDNVQTNTPWHVMFTVTNKGQKAVDSWNYDITLFHGGVFLPVKSHVPGPPLPLGGSLTINWEAPIMFGPNDKGEWVILVGVTVDDPGNPDSSLSNNRAQGHFVVDNPTATLLSLFQAQPTTDAIELRWQFGDPQSIVSADVERAGAVTGPWRAISAERRNEGGITVAIDRDVQIGQTYYYRIVARTTAGERMTFGPLSGTLGEAIADFELPRVSPNPTTGPAHLEFAVPREAQVKLSIVDVQGRVMAVLANGVYRPGRYAATWSGRTERGPAPMGVYLVVYQAQGVNLVKRLVLSR